MTGIARQRAARYRLLSRCFHAPDEALLRELSEAVDWVGSDGLPPLSELRKEHARLFVGPFELPAPPYGSIYLEDGGLVWGDSTNDAVRRYREEGLKVSMKEPGDHVAIELEFMYLLAFREAEAMAAEDATGVERYRARQSDFLGRHLGAWLPSLTERVVENAELPFYAEVVTAADAFVREDLAGLRRPDSSGSVGSSKADESIDSAAE